MKRIAYIGLSYPIRFDNTKSIKSWLAPGAKIERFPYIESPWGMMLLFDELWFLCRDVCPVNMRKCSFVRFVSEMYPQMDYKTIFDSVNDTEVKPDCHVLTSDEFYANYRSYPGSISTNAYDYCGVGNNILLGGISPDNYLFDIKVKLEVERISKVKLEMITNSHIQYEDYLSQVKMLDFSNTLILNGIPNFISQMGPYHPVIDELRDSQYIYDFRKWILERKDHIQNSEISEMKEAVEADLKDITEKMMLKYFEKNDVNHFYQSTAKTIINTAIGLFVAPYSVAVAANDLIENREAMNEAVTDRWSAFIIESRRRMKELTKKR